MKKVFLLLLFLFISCNLSQKSIFNKIKNTKIDTQVNDKTVFINSGTARKSFEVIINNVVFYVVYEKEIPIYIETNDLNFFTDEGLNMESTVSECMMISNKIKVEPGIGIYISLNNNWRVYIDSDENSFKLSDRVKYFCYLDDCYSNSMNLSEWNDYLMKSDSTIPEPGLKETNISIIPID
jgi:hypothetical protein